jgi:hypothetical protein
MRLRGFSILLAAMLVSGFAATPAFCESDAEAEGGAGAPSSKQSGSGSVWEKDPSAWKIAIYPLYGWLPIMGASSSITLPDRPNLPSRPGTANGGTMTGSLNGAGFAGFNIEKSRVVAHGTLLYASISGDNTNPNLHLGLKVFYGEGFGGDKIYKDLSLEGGVRRMSLNINARVADRPGVSGKPGIWDPLIGMSWKHQMGRKWLLTTNLNGGGFGVGSDVSLGATGRVDWRFARHFGMTMGLAALHFQLSPTLFDSTRIERTLKIKQTLWGPLIGFGIYF